MHTNGAQLVQCKICGRHHHTSDCTFFSECSVCGKVKCICGYKECRNQPFSSLKIKPQVLTQTYD